MKKDVILKKRAQRPLFLKNIHIFALVNRTLLIGAAISWKKIPAAVAKAFFFSNT